MKPRESHSEKGLKTLTAMGTQPQDWALTPIKWVMEKRMGFVRKPCPDCYARGRTYIVIATGQKSLDADSTNINDRNPDGWKSRNVYAPCPTCSTAFAKLDLKWGRGKGEIIVEELVDMCVGYPVWPKGCKFDSRFELHDRSNCMVCALCSKSITGRWSYTIPVNGRGADGVTHGMWVGEDCARKFLGVELVLDMEQLSEMKKSVRKERIRIERLA